MIWVDLDGVLRDYVTSMGLAQDEVRSYHDPRLDPPDPARLLEAPPYEGAIPFFRSLPYPKGICTCAPLETVEPWLRKVGLWPTSLAWFTTVAHKLFLGGILIDDHPYLEGRPRVITVGRPWNATEWQGWDSVLDSVLQLLLRKGGE